MSTRRALMPSWMTGYEMANFRPDLAAGLTVGAMLVPQAMAYALLAGLPPEIGLYAATIPVLVYALLGTSPQLAVGPVAIVSLITATALGGIAEEMSADYIAAAALLALIVGLVHIIVGAGRLGYLVNFLSHAVLVGFTAAAALIIGFSQVKHLLGISVERHEYFYQTVNEVVGALGGTHSTTLILGLVCLAIIFGLKRFAPRVPGALVVVIGSLLAVEMFDLEARGVKTVGAIPDNLPSFAIPTIDAGLVGTLLPTALVITLVGFMESIAVAKVYARRHRTDLSPNRELVALGSANVASGLFGGYPVTGGFSRTAVNDSAGARTPLASVVTAGIVLLSIAFLTPLLDALPQAALGAIIVSAIIGLIDIKEMRHITKVKPSDTISLVTAFVATLALGIELGILVAVVVSMLVVFARMSMPHSAVLGHVEGTTTYRNVERFPEVQVTPGVQVLRVDASLSFVNSNVLKERLLAQAESEPTPHAIVLEASGINDLDATGADMLAELLPEFDSRGISFHLSDVKGPVRDVLRRAHLWDALDGRVHASTHEAIEAIEANRSAPTDQRAHGIDERCGRAEAVEAVVTGPDGHAIDTEAEMTVHSEQSENLSELIESGGSQP